MVERPVFQEHFWWCYDQFRQEATEDIGVPGYFRFMTLLGEAIGVIVRMVGHGSHA